MDTSRANGSFADHWDRYFPHYDFSEFHLYQLPARIQRVSSLVARDLKDLAPLAIQLRSGEAFTYLPQQDTVFVEPGVHGAATVVALSSKDFSDFVHEIFTISGLVMKEQVVLVNGDMETVRRWEPALRAMYSGRPIYGEHVQHSMLDPLGSLYDLSRSFTMDDSDFDLRSFLDAVGLLHIKQVFPLDEINRMRDAVELARASTAPDDGFSWWSTTRDGYQEVSRINYLSRFSSLFNEIGVDQRIQRLGRLLNPDARACLDRIDGPMTSIKPANVEAGLANLLWHKDCDSGGHPVLCPLLQVGIQLDAANAVNGQVRFLPGSHKYSNHLIKVNEESALPYLDVETEAGDVTIHCGHILHCTPPPTGEQAGRRVLYYKFAKPALFDRIPEGCHFNDLMFRKDSDGRVASQSGTWSSKRQLKGGVD